MVLCSHASKAKPRIESGIRIGDLWLGGVIPVRVRIGETEFTTSLFPKDGRYLVPIKASVRKAENLEKDDKVTIRLEVNL